MASTTEGITSHGRPLRILVVDDYPQVADGLAKCLRLLGHEVEAAMSGSEGIAAAENLHPDVMFVDIAMPDLNGLQVAKRIRQRPWSKTLFLVALSGYCSDEDRKLGQEAGFDAYLRKPISLIEMGAVLAASLSGSGASTERKL